MAAGGTRGCEKHAANARILLRANTTHTSRHALRRHSRYLQQPKGLGELVCAAENPPRHTRCVPATSGWRRRGSGQAQRGRTAGRGAAAAGRGRTGGHGVQRQGLPQCEAVVAAQAVGSQNCDYSRSKRGCTHTSPSTLVHVRSRRRKAWAAGTRLRQRHTAPVRPPCPSANRDSHRHRKQAGGVTARPTGRPLPV
jgi:hypothetical protein